MKISFFRNIAFLSLITLLFVACKVDFSPNATWKEIPVVYCVLDQEDDTTYVRVQKCYLGEGNEYNYATVYDSINYPEGSLEVKILEWKAVLGKANILTIDPSATAPLRTFDCQYKLLTDKDEGQFSAPNQPVYVYRTAGLLDTARVYQLLVIKKATGDTLAMSTTSLIGNYLNMATLITRPNNNNVFQFSGSGSKICVVEWHNLPRARQYRPMVRFNYRDVIISSDENGYDTTIVRRYIDVNCSVVKSDLVTSTFQTNLYEETFLAVIYDSLRNKLVDTHGTPIVRNVIDTVDIFMNCCTEDLAAYLYSHSTNGSITQESYAYTNIKGGLGVFAARRTHLRYRVRSVSAINSRYLAKLKALGVGF